MKFRSKGRSDAARNKRKILGAIWKKEEGARRDEETGKPIEETGLHVQEIANKADLHRDTVRRLCKELESDSYITRKNKQSPYRLTGKAYSDPVPTPLMFQGQAVRNMRKWEWLTLTNKFCNTTYCKEIYDNIDKSTSPEDLKDRDQLTLFELANRIGALIVYSMIQACRPKKIEVDINDLKMDLNLKRGHYKDRMAIAWIDSINGSQLFSEFSKLDIVKEGLSRYNPIPFSREETKKEVIQELVNSLPSDVRIGLKQHLGPMRSVTNDDSLNVQRISNDDFDNLLKDIEEKYPDVIQDIGKWLNNQEQGYQHMLERQYDPENPLWSYYEMHKHEFTRLVKAYAAVYPNLYKYLENTRHEAIDKVARIRTSKLDPDHTKCDGQQVPEIEVDIVIKGKKAKVIKLKKCLKCGQSLNANEIVKETN